MVAYCLGYAPCCDWLRIGSCTFAKKSRMALRRRLGGLDGMGCAQSWALLADFKHAMSHTRDLVEVAYVGSQPT